MALQVSKQQHDAEDSLKLEIKLQNRNVTYVPACFILNIYNKNMLSEASQSKLSCQFTTYSNRIMKWYDCLAYSPV